MHTLNIHKVYGIKIDNIEKIYDDTEEVLYGRAITIQSREGDIKIILTGMNVETQEMKDELVEVMADSEEQLDKLAGEKG